MIAEIIIFIFLGMLFGTFAGMIPGIHPNTIAIMFSSAAVASFFPGIECFIVFIVAMSVANSVFSFLPAIFLGAPEEGSSLSALPGHRLLMKGMGYYAVKLSIIGGIGSAFLCAVMLPAAMRAIPVIYEATRPFLHIILSMVVVYMLSMEKRKVSAAFCFFAAGAIGIIGGGMCINQSFYLFPVLSGLFGVPMLILSIRNREKLPLQKRTGRNISSKTISTSVVTGSVAGILVGILPGIGASQAAVLANAASRKNFSTAESDGFLISMGGVTLSNTLFSFLALWLINNPRSGAAVAISNFAEIGFNEFLLIFSVALLACGLSSVAALKVAGIFSRLVEKIDYALVSKCVIAFIFTMVFLFTSFSGVFLLCLTTCLGIFTNLSKVHRSQMMGVLLLPSIIFFSGI